MNCWEGGAIPSKYTPQLMGWIDLEVALVNWRVRAILSLKKCESKQMINHITYNKKTIETIEINKE